MKNMKIAFVAVLVSLISAQTFAQQDKKTVPAKISEATVFYQGAELIHTATASLVKGENEIHISGLSPQIDINSLKIKASNSVVVSAYEFSVDYLNPNKVNNPILKKIDDSIAMYQANINKVHTDLKINSEMIAHLQAGITKNISGSEKGLGIEELMKTMDYFKSKSEEMEALKTSLSAKSRQYYDAIQRLHQQKNQESMKGNKTSGVLKLTLAAPAAANTNFTVSYFTSAASWIPYYDINILSTDKPIIISAKSKVRQTTGLDWERVKLTLSTATPSNGKVAPLFSSWFLEQMQIYAKERAMVQNAYSYDIQGSDDPCGVDPRTVNRQSATHGGVAYKGQLSDVKVISDGFQSIKREDLLKPKEPIYVINGNISTQQSFDALDRNVIKDVKTLNGAEAASLYGSRAAAGAVVVTLKSGMEDYVTASDNVMNVTYNIDMPYTIPGNGKVQNIDLMKKETAAEYKYYCAPKLDGETFLLAEISDWEKLGLLSGMANITYDGTYIGETFIDAFSTQEKLALTLGTDKRVAVKREKLQDFSSRKVMGSDILQVFTYQITVKNNQTKAVKMVLKDQYPISTQKNIEVILRKETTPWTANKEDVGVITWEEELKPGETKTYKISYSVKYPKDMTLNL